MAKKKVKSNGFLSVFDVIKRMSFDWICPPDKEKAKCCGGKCTKKRKRAKKK